MGKAKKLSSHKGTLVSSAQLCYSTSSAQLS